ncbi:MAG TPA: hypothetical protein VHL53_06225, partial [Acidimicrobiia bacterium]|nr:hypothetical protein [Acidimicrobiia bacterium]
EVKGHQTVWIDVPGGRTKAVRVAADGDRLVCFGDDGLSDVAEGTALFASVRGLACGPLEKYFRVHLHELKPDEVSISQVADIVGNTRLGHNAAEVNAALEAQRSSRRLVALEG